MRLEFHPEAELELIEAALHYEQEVPGLGESFEAEVWRATNLLLEHPGMGQAVDTDLRRFVLPRFPFTLIYHLQCSRGDSPDRSGGASEPPAWLLAREA